jgi:hypothetical protein
LAKARGNAAQLSPAERVQLTFFSRATFRGVANAFFQHRQGLMSESAWSDYEAIIRMNLGRPDVREWWPTDRSSYDETFASFVVRLLAKVLE